ncbi:MAG: hypothetical protein ABIQ42_11000 [Rhodoferax sp.]|uniref:hypothetical protein n=1 Tax=Rhodoferax sp. TaxID=50421 RepID=UPI003264731B
MPDSQTPSSMQHLLVQTPWRAQKPLAGPNEFRLFCTENLPSQPYLPAGDLLHNK